MPDHPDSLDHMLHEVHERLPGADYSRSSGVDLHHQVVGDAWEIRRDEELLLPGFDVTELADEGRVLRVLGFFGPLPDDDNEG